MRFYVSEQISPRIGKTPDGFLVCFDVPIARTGKMIYHKSEADLMPWLNSMEFDSEGNLTVLRDAAEVFREETVASGQGKPVTVDHPDEFVDPDNWPTLARGTSQNVRRGEREQADLLLADLLVTVKDAIEYVESGELRQISVGYDAEYEQVSPGMARQKDIVINHVALVQRGRAGVRCMIMDSEKGKKMNVKDRFLSLFRKTLDEMTEEDLKELEKEKKTGDADADGDIGTRLDKLEKSVDALVESDKKLHESMDCFMKGTKDSEEEEAKKNHEEAESKKKEDEEEGAVKDKKTKDAASRAEILFPGFTVDSAKSLDSIKREALAASWKTDEGRKAIEPFTGSTPDFEKLSGPTLDAAFIGSSTLLAQRNNSQFASRSVPVIPKSGASVADMNAKNREFWKNNS